MEVLPPIQDEKAACEMDDKIPDILYEILMKYNGSFGKNNIDMASKFEKQELEKELSKAHKIVCSNRLIS